jgi:predicted kinase
LAASYRTVDVQACATFASACLVIPITRPLLLVGGPAGAGKSTLRSELLERIPEVVALESDLLWRREYEADHEGFRRLWLRLAADIALSGRPVVIFGAGFAVPHNIETLEERAAFSSVHYLAVTCEDDVLAARIRARKAPRRTDDRHIDEQVDFNRWLRKNAATTAPGITLVDTTHSTIEEAAARVNAWIHAIVPR